MNALITKMKMGEHEHDEAVNVDELKWWIRTRDLLPVPHSDQLLVRPHFFSLADMNVNI